MPEFIAQLIDDFIFLKIINTPCKLKARNILKIEMVKTVQPYLFYWTQSYCHCSEIIYMSGKVIGYCLYRHNPNCDRFNFVFKSFSSHCYSGLWSSILPTTYLVQNDNKSWQTFLGPLLGWPLFCAVNECNNNMFYHLLKIYHYLSAKTKWWFY